MNRLIVLLFIFLAACKAEFPSIPKDVIPMKEMVKVMADIHITDVIAAEKAQGGLDEKKLSLEYYQRIYTNHGITKEKFIRSYHFYESHPGLFDKMYEEVLVEMSRREGEIKQ
jgi:hypothetical protein